MRFIIIPNDSIWFCVLDPPVIMRKPTADLVVQGRNATLQCRADGNPPVYYEWFRVSNFDINHSMWMNLYMSSQRSLCSLHKNMQNYSR